MYQHTPNRTCRSCGAPSPDRLCLPCIARIEAKDDYCSTCGSACPVPPNADTDPMCDDCLNHRGAPINGQELM